MTNATHRWLVVGAFIAAALILSRCVYADEQCIAWAELVERVEQMSDEQRQWSAWLAQADGQVMLRYLLTARNWLASGRTGEQAWLECEST